MVLVVVVMILVVVVVAFHIVEVVVVVVVVVAVVVLKVVVTLLVVILLHICFLSFFRIDIMGDDSFRIGVVIELLILSILGIIGNLLVIAVYIRQKHVHSAVVFILTLAVTDFVTCLVTIPFTIATELVHYQLQYDFFCKLYYFLLTSTVPFSAFMMTAIAVDRFLCIVGPFRYRFSVLCARIVSVCLAVMAATCGIITSLMYGVPAESHVYYFDGHCIGVSDHLPDDANHIWQKIYSSFYLICGVAVIIIYAIIYVHVIGNHNIEVLLGRHSSGGNRNQTELALMNQSDHTTSDQTPVVPHDGSAAVGTNSQTVDVTRRTASGSGNARLSTRRHIQLGFMLSVVAFVYLICFLPAWLMSHGLIGFNAIVFYFYFSYHVTNPIIYSLISESFRRKLTRQCFRRFQDGQQHNISSSSLSTSVNQ